jgi:hypothetical protein
MQIAQGASMKVASMISYIKSRSSCAAPIAFFVIEVRWLEETGGLVGCNYRRSWATRKKDAKRVVHIKPGK